jgi:hypothetical protein
MQAYETTGFRPPSPASRPHWNKVFKSLSYIDSKYNQAYGSLVLTSSYSDSNPEWKRKCSLFFVKESMFPPETLATIQNPKRRFDENVPVYTINGSPGMLRLLFDVLAARK